jgi:hypothetical protein
MIALPAGMQVYLAAGATDMHKGFDDWPVRRFGLEEAASRTVGSHQSLYLQSMGGPGAVARDFLRPPKLRALRSL